MTQSAFGKSNQGRDPCWPWKPAHGHLGSVFLDPECPGCGLDGALALERHSPLTSLTLPCGEGCGWGREKASPSSHGAQGSGSFCQDIRVVLLLIMLGEEQGGYSLYPLDLNCDDVGDMKLPFCGGSIKSKGRKKRKPECMEHLCQARLCAIHFCLRDLI